MKYLSVVEYEDGRRVLRFGKEKVEGADVFMNDELKDAERLSFERRVLYRLSENISKSQARDELEQPLTEENLPDWFPQWLYPLKTVICRSRMNRR